MVLKNQVSRLDGVAEHLALLKTVFDFGALREFVARPDFSMAYDAMHAVSGPTARRVFHDELGLPLEGAEEEDDPAGARPSFPRPTPVLPQSTSH